MAALLGLGNAACAETAMPSRYGEVLLPADGHVEAFVVFYPPASGERGRQRAEAASLRGEDIASLLYRPPYLRSDSSRSPRSRGGPGDIPGEIALWESARVELIDVLWSIQKDYGIGADRVALVGKNFGGAAASFAAPSSVACVIVSGTVPQLSKFMTHSNHPVARQFREGFSAGQLSDFEAATRKFDLTSTLPAAARRLVQLGSRDDWIEGDEVQALAEALQGMQDIAWSNDDHAMDSENARQARLEFIHRCLKR